VRGHKGALKVYSELGKGTSFKLLLPANYESHEPIEMRASSHPDRFGHGTILVIDDEETVRAVTSRMLEVMGFSTLTAADERDAVALYRERSAEITCVLVDLTMPHLDGEETFRELRRINPDVRVLLMSGYNEQDAIARFVGKGLAGFVQKPFNLSELRERLFALLG
jgi:two-component system cell cycle sensor histidine kinase/response regulator CckA